MVIEEIKKIDSGPKRIREFGWVMFIAFSVIGGILLWRGKASGPAFFCAGAFFAVLTLVAPGVLSPFQKVWMTFAVLMGWVMSRVILSVLFYLVITPIGLLLRMTGKDLLDQKLEPSKRSYWKERPAIPPDLTRCEKQF